MNSQNLAEIIFSQIAWCNKQTKFNSSYKSRTREFGCTRMLREKGKDLTHSYDKRPFTHRKIKRAT